MRIAPALLALAVAACSRSEPPPARTGDAAPRAETADGTLTDERMERFVASIDAADNPFAFVFRGEAASTTPDRLDALRPALEEFSRRHGIGGAEDYLGIWMRVVLVQAAELSAATRGLATEAVSLIEARLAAPDLGDDERRRLTEELSRARADLERGPVIDGVDPADVAVVRRFGPRLDAALARARARR